ncbi:MAG TPA: RNA methyltransferase [Chitinophagaceae bacterium]|nr:RNA methyltransferase [Chitinophagaceae bacterium]
MNSLSDAPGFDRQAFAAVHTSGEQVTSIRINPTKISGAELQHIRSAHIDANYPSAIANIQVPVPWSRHGYYLSQRPSFTLDPLLHAGCYYVQEASSMFLEQALVQTTDCSQPLKVLDLCAAPGGKSTLLQSFITPGSLLVSNEVIKSRSIILHENITKWGAANVVVTNNDPKDFQRLPNYFDVLVIDAPCSGSGLFRRDPEAIQEWSEANVALCCQRQQRIVADALPALRPDGVLIYCTCSYSMEEDEQVIDWLIDEFDMSSLPLSVDASWNIVESFSPKHHAACYRFYPDKLRGEGFFLTCLRKQEGNGTTGPATRQKAEKLSKPELELTQHWIDPAVPLHLFRHKEDVIAVPTGFEQIIPILQERLYLRQSGITVGKLGRTALIPDHSLALSGIFNNAITTISLNHGEALQYLRKAEVFAVSAHKGWALVQYEGHNLGWIKLLGNRVNNYYPREWRILKN